VGAHPPVFRANLVKMPATEASKASPLAVPTNTAYAKLYVTEKTMWVLPYAGEGARLHIRSEVVARSKFLQASAASPCPTEQIIQVLYEAFCRWFIFVLSDMGKGGQTESALPGAENGSANTPPPMTAHIDRCSTEELLHVFVVRFGRAVRRCICQQAQPAAVCNVACFQLSCLACEACSLSDGSMRFHRCTRRTRRRTHSLQRATLSATCKPHAQVARALEDPQTVARAADAAWDKFLPAKQRRPGPIGRMAPLDEPEPPQKGGVFSSLFRKDSTGSRSGRRSAQKQLEVQTARHHVSAWVHLFNEHHPVPAVKVMR
jgi:hypothetical protein